MSVLGLFCMDLTALGLYCQDLGPILESLSTDVFEPRTPTRSRLFFSFECVIDFLSLTSTYKRKNEGFPTHLSSWECVKNNNGCLPDVVRGSKTSLLKLPILPVIYHWFSLLFCFLKSVSTLAYLHGKRMGRKKNNHIILNLSRKLCQFSLDILCKGLR